MVKKVFSMLIPVVVVGMVVVPRITIAQGCNTLYTLTRASVSSAGVQGDGQSYDPTLSGSGRYVGYVSAATNLVADDTNLSDDIFVYDRQNCQTQRVSVSTTGTEANGSSSSPSFSADGRRLVFDSSASNLVAFDSFGFTDVFQRNVPNSQTERVSLTNSEASPNEGAFNDSMTPLTSADGRYVVFTSTSTNLTTIPDAGIYRDVFLRDNQLGTTELISVSTTGTPGNGNSYWASVSQDGRYVAFQSEATDLIANGSSFHFNIFVRDRQLGTTTRINGIGGAAPDAPSINPTISGDGRYIAFASEATNYVSNDPAGLDVFLHDRQSGTTIRVTNGAGGGGFLYPTPSLSYDGRYLVFSSDANNLVPNDTNDTGDVFLYDRVTAELSRVSVAANGAEGNAQSYRGTISSDGSTISYMSFATNLVANDTNDQADVFVLPRYIANGGNLLANSDFDAGFAGWGAFGDPAGALDMRVQNGVLEFSRAVRPEGGDNTAVVLQESGYAVPNGGGLDATVSIGNSSAVRKRVTILLHDSDFSDLQVCTFWLPPNAPLRSYRMTARTTETWTNATISIYAATADGLGYYQVDDAVLKLVPPPTSSRTLCYDPDAPPVNPEEDSDDWITNGSFDDGFNGWLEFFAIQTQVTGGVLEFYGDGMPAGVAFQETTNEVDEGTVIEARFDLGSSSPSRRRITILLRDADFSDLTACTFWLAPNASLQTYVIRAFTTEDWTGASISFYPATQGSNGWYRVDNVSFRARPNKFIIGTECYPPGTAPAGQDDIHVDPFELFTPLEPTATPSGGNFYAQPGVVQEIPIIMTPTPIIVPVDSGEGTIGE